MKLGKLMIFASDLVLAKQFYCEILGFPFVSDTGGRLDLRPDGCDLVIFKCEKDTSVNDYSEKARTVFVFEVDSVVEKMTELKNRGVKFLHEEPAENDFSLYAAFADPFGNVHEIFQKK